MKDSETSSDTAKGGRATGDQRSAVGQMPLNYQMSAMGSSWPPKPYVSVYETKLADITEFTRILEKILECDDLEIGLCDRDGGAPGESSPYQSEMLKHILDAARALLAKGKASTTKQGDE